jgi:hypothetical protein
MSKTFAEQTSQVSLHGSPLVANDVRTKIAVGSRCVSIVANFLGGIDNDCNRETVMFAGELHQWLTVLGPDVGRVDDGQQASRQAFASQVVQDFKSIARRFLVVLIIGDPATERIGGENLVGCE